MKMKQAVLTAAVAAGLALSSGQAAAYIYADSGVTITGLTVLFSQPSTVTVTNFQFTLTDSATLNGSGALQTAECHGLPASNNCNAGPVVDAQPANAPLSTPITRTNNAAIGGNFTSYGPLGGLGTSTGNWSNSDTVINTAELVTGTPTSSNQIAESLITTATSASASAQIQSITGFTITFTTTGPTENLAINFSADPDLMAAIQNQLSGSFGANASINAEFTLTSNSGAGSIRWDPNGVVVAGDCATSGGFTGTCTETADSQNLNTSVGTTVNNTVAPFSFDPNLLTPTAFGIAITGLTAGAWTLTFSAVTATQLNFTPVPEPGVLALLGIGLMGLFATTRRKTLS